MVLNPYNPPSLLLDLTDTSPKMSEQLANGWVKSLDVSGARAPARAARRRRPGRRRRGRAGARRRLASSRPRHWILSHLPFRPAPPLSQPGSGREYYANAGTGQTSWEVPPE